MKSTTSDQAAAERRALLKQAFDAIETMKARIRTLESGAAGPIAIVGAGCRLPGGVRDLDSYWQLLSEGRDGVSKLAARRWRTDDPREWHAGVVEGVDQFDPHFFNISAREARTMDPQQRMLMEVAWESIENAGLSPQKLAGSRTGVFIGITAQEYVNLVARSSGPNLDVYTVTGNAHNVSAGRISYLLELHGPSMAVDSACSASLVSIHLACQSLRTGECSIALAGGVNALLSPDPFVCFSNWGMMAADGRCKTFDARADGFVRSEGCAVVVLKRLADALADGDHILALIRGSAVNQDGRSGGLTVPNGAAQEAVIRQALANAGVSPAAIRYTEAHGTGTSLGDPIEAQALAAVLGEGRTGADPLVVGSVKTNLGHLESAAGVTGLLKVVLALRNEKIPAHLHFSSLNPAVDWGGVPVVIPTTARPWPKGEGKRLAGVSSFGFSGTNAYVILEEAPEVTPCAREYERPIHILALSARSEAALASLAGRYSEYLSHTEAGLADICYTANAGRAHFEYRLATSGNSVEEIRSKLATVSPAHRARESRAARPVFLFPGRGAEYAGLGKQLYETQPAFRGAIEECATAIQGELAEGLQDALWGPSRHLLQQAVYADCALFSVEYGLAQLWKSWGIEPCASVGQEVGEYAAACAAGAFSAADGMKLIAARTRLVEGTAQTAEAEDAFRAVAGSVKYQTPRVKLISSLTGEPLEPNQISDPGYWLKQARGQLHLQAAMEALRQEEIFLEVGPGATLVSRARQSLAREDGLWLLSLGDGRSEWGQLLESLGSLYVGGADVDWERFDAGYGRRRVMLPSYPFERQRYWVEDGVNADLPKSSAADTPERPAPAVDDWFYTVTWQERPLAGAWRARPGDEWIVLPDKSGVGDALTQVVRANGSSCLPAAGYDAFDRVAPGASGQVHIVDLRALDAGADSAVERCQALADLVRNVSRRDRLRACLWVVTAGAQALDNRVAPWQSPLWGLGRTISVEHADCWGGLVDLDPASDAPRNAAMLWQHMISAEGENQAAFRHGRRLVARLERQAAPPVQSPAVGPGGAYLITGGLGGLGLEVARWLVAHGARRLILMGRTPLPPRKEWRQLPAGSPHARAVYAIRELEGRGAVLQTAALDLGDPSEVRRFFDSYEEEGLPPIRGVVHAAGIVRQVRLAEASEEHFREVFHGKVDGAWLLHKAFEHKPLDFFILFSSASALISLPQMGPYAAANAFLDGLAAYRRNAGQCALSVNWGPWSESGMYARFVSDGAEKPGARAVAGMTTREGLHCLARLFGHYSAGVAVLPASWNRWVQAHAGFAAGPFLAGLFATTAPPKLSQRDPQRIGEQLLGVADADLDARLLQYLVGAFAAIVGFDAATIDPSRRITECGLDSLMALELRNRVSADLGVTISTKRLLEGPTVQELAFLLAGELPRTSGPGEAVSALTPVEEYPLGCGQQAQWFQSKIVPDSATFNIAFTAKATPPLEWAAFERAVGQMEARHPALRTVFFENGDGEPMQRVLASIPSNAVLVDAAAWTEAELERNILEDFSRPFELHRPLLRISLYRCDGYDVILFSVHHIIMDAWSLRLCFRDLKLFYQGELAGVEPKVEPLEGGFHEFVEWEASMSRGPECERLWAYWKEQLSGPLPLLQLPSSRPRPTVMVPRGDWVRLRLDDAAAVGVRRIAREYGTTAYTVLLAAYQTLLHGYTGQQDIIVGTSTSGRDKPTWANVVGCFINLLPIRASLSGTLTFAQLLMRTRDAVLGAIEHQAMPFPVTVTKLCLQRTLERSPVFQAFFNFLTDREGELSSLFIPDCTKPVAFGASVLSPSFIIPQQLGQSEIVAQIFEGEGRFAGFLNYNIDILDRAVAESMAAEYCRIIEEITKNPNVSVSELLTSVMESEREEFIF